MKTKLSRRLQSAILCLVLLAAAIPFATLAQMIETPETDDMSITLAGALDGCGSFVFEGNIIYYLHEDYFYMKPNKVAVNGKVWDDFNKPFELEYTPNYANAVITGKQGEGAVDMETVANRLYLTIDNRPVVSSKSYTVTLSLPKQDAVTEKVAEEEPSDSRLTIVLSGKSIREKGSFLFQKNQIIYRPEKALYRNKTAFNKDNYPSGMTVNGKPWIDMDQPFELDFVTDYATVRIDDYDGNILCKKILHRESSRYIEKLDRSFDLIVAPQTEESTPFEIAMSVAKLQNDYAARMLKMNRSELKNLQISTLIRKRQANPDELDEKERQQLEQWDKESKAWRTEPDYTTDGKTIPVSYPAAGRMSVRDLSATHAMLEIDAVIDFNAQFVIRENQITYSYLRPAAGKFPSQVRINGKPWTNLYIPFDLGMSLDLESIALTSIDTEFYRYIIGLENGKAVTISIDNHGVREEPVKIRLSIKKQQ
ncbi:MAG: hypothetical protein PUC15_06630 [Lentisphaeria bacterium]|nr:hypothetical protein [Lentisphaeria bacterium]